VPRKAQWSVLGHGNNGGVIQGPPGVVYKVTYDPVEIQSWLAAASMARRGRLPLGLPAIYDLRLGHRAAVVVREDVDPLGERHGLDPLSIAALQSAGRLSAKGRLHRNRPAWLKGRKIRSRGLYGPLRQVGQAVLALERMGARPSDLRPENLGRTPHGLVLHDPGRSPIETTVAGVRSPGVAPCPETKKLASAVREMLRTAPSYKDCKVVNESHLTQVMKRHGWKDTDIKQTAGFHGEDNVIYLLQHQEWTLLHELVHAAGVVDRDLASWLTEGLTEAVAQDVAHKRNWTHHPTYPQYVKIVRNKVAPAAALSIPQLGRLVAVAPKQAGHHLAQKLHQEYPSISTSTWYKALGPGVLTPAPLEKILRKVK
jgi:hypothetical protein